MKTPIRIIVVGDFGATSNTSGTLRAAPGGTDDLIGAFCPSLTLANGNQYHIKAMKDFEVEGVTSRLGSAVASSEDITNVLHDGAFQQAEGAWRGLDYLVSKLPSEGVALDVLSSPYDDLRRNFYDWVMKPDYDLQSEIPATLILADYDFDYQGDSFEVFCDLAKMAEAIRAPFVAQTGASFFNLKHLLHLPTINNPLDRIGTSAYSAYHAFRETDTSFWASLLLNRFLLRPPHETQAYKEPASASKPEQYLWGRGIWILGANIIRSFESKGHLVGVSGLGTGGEQLNLPIRELPLSRKEKVLSPLEAVLPVDIVEGLPYLGLSPLSQVPADMGGQNQPGMIYLHLAANLKHIPDPEEKQYGLLTVHASLAYSLMLGRLSNLAFKCSRDLKDETPEQAAVLLKDALLKDVWFKEEDELQVEIKDTGISISYKPYLVIHTRRFEIELDLPL